MYADLLFSTIICFSTSTIDVVLYVWIHSGTWIWFSCCRDRSCILVSNSPCLHCILPTSPPPHLAIPSVFLTPTFMISNYNRIALPNHSVSLGGGIRSIAMHIVNEMIPDYQRQILHLRYAHRTSHG